MILSYCFVVRFVALLTFNRSVSFFGFSYLFGNLIERKYNYVSSFNVMKCKYIKSNMCLRLSPTEFFQNLNVSVPSVLVGTIIGFALPFAISSFIQPYNNIQTVNDDIEERAEVLNDILFDLKSEYVEDINVDKLFETGVNAMLKTLDPYTVFENRKEAKSFQESVAGRYGGVGLIISSSKSNSRSFNNILPSPTSSPNSEQSPTIKKTSPDQVPLNNNPESVETAKAKRPG